MFFTHGQFLDVRGFVCLRDPDSQATRSLPVVRSVLLQNSDQLNGQIKHYLKNKKNEWSINRQNDLKKAD